MPQAPSMFRLYLLRLLYLGNFVGLGIMVWPEIIKHEGAWEPVRGVAFCFWAALSALSGLGLRVARARLKPAGMSTAAFSGRFSSATNCRRRSS